MKAIYDTAAHLITRMAFEEGARKELQEVSIKISKGFPRSGTSLASMESLSRPLVWTLAYSSFSFNHHGVL